MKYFMTDDSEYVFTLDYFKEMLIDDELEEMELLEVKSDIGGEMWCSRKEYFIESGDCGCLCPQYNPCNGKNGRCRHLKNGFVLTGKKFLLTKDGLKDV